MLVVLYRLVFIQVPQQHALKLSLQSLTHMFTRLVVSASCSVHDFSVFTLLLSEYCVTALHVFHRKRKSKWIMRLLNWPWDAVGGRSGVVSVICYVHTSGLSWILPLLKYTVGSTQVSVRSRRFSWRCYWLWSLSSVAGASVNGRPMVGFVPEFVIIRWSININSGQPFGYHWLRGLSSVEVNKFEDYNFACSLLEFLIGWGSIRINSCIDLEFDTSRGHSRWILMHFWVSMNFGFDSSRICRRPRIRQNQFTWPKMCWWIYHWLRYDQRWSAWQQLSDFDRPRSCSRCGYLSIAVDTLLYFVGPPREMLDQHSSMNLSIVLCNWGRQ